MKDEKQRLEEALENYFRSRAELNAEDLAHARRIVLQAVEQRKFQIQREQEQAEQILGTKQIERVSVKPTYE